MLDALIRSLAGDLPELAKDPLGIFTAKSLVPGGVAPLAIGLKRGYLVGDTAHVRHVLLDNAAAYDKRTPAFEAVRVVLGNGLLTSGGAFWKRQRRIAQPAFHGEKVRRFGPILSRMAAECADRWEQAAATGTVVDAGTDMMEVTLRAVAEALFGDDLAASIAEINRVFPVILAELAGRVVSPLRAPLWCPTRSNRALVPALRSLDRIVGDLIAKRRRNLAAIEARPPNERDLLATLMLARDAETGESMSDRQLRDEVMTLLIAGHETTASALAWTWYLLDRHPDEQERLRDALRAAVGDRGPTVDDLPARGRFRMVMLVALRLYPPVWMFDRRALEADRLGDVAIRRGDLVIVCPYAIHRNPALWSDPETFRPERFEPGREEQRDKFAYLPFGAGARQCMGMSFAMIESQIILGTLLSRFRARLHDGAEVHPRAIVTLRPDRPILLRLQPA